MELDGASRKKCLVTIEQNAKAQSKHHSFNSFMMVRQEDISEWRRR